MGVPKNPVTADSGISDAVKLLEMISQIIVNIPPKMMVNGMVFFESLPTSNRTKCGIINPIQPIIPLYATAAAVNRVEITMINPL